MRERVLLSRELRSISMRPSSEAGQRLLASSTLSRGNRTGDDSLLRGATGSFDVLVAGRISRSFIARGIVRNTLTGQLGRRRRHGKNLSTRSPSRLAGE